MYESSQRTCIKLIEEGYVHTFEEILNLTNTYEKIRAEAERSLDKTMPKDFRKEIPILQYIEENLIDAEEAIRKDLFEENYRSRMKLGRHFQELEGYHWLAVYFYESSQTYKFEVSIDVKLTISSLQRQALLEEARGNLNDALKFLEKALKLANKNSLDEADPVLKNLNEDLCRVYQLMGTKYLEKESNTVDAKKSVSVKFFKKATKIAMSNDDLEIQATCQALLGKGLLKFNNDESAAQSFEIYTELSEKCNDKYGMCQGYFAISEIFKRTGDLENSILSLRKCQDLANEHNFNIPFIFSAISLGQIETAKRQYLKAYEYFTEAYDVNIVSKEDYVKKKSLTKLTMVMYGIGKAHLTFKNLVTTLQSPINLLLPKILSWKRKGGPFTGEITEKQDRSIDLEAVEKDEKAESVVIEKLIHREFDKK